MSRGEKFNSLLDDNAGGVLARAAQWSEGGLTDVAHETRVYAKLDWTNKNKELKAMFLEHTTEVADFVIELEQACTRHGTLTLYDHHDLLPMMPAATTKPRAHHNPFKLKPTVVTTTYPQGRKKVQRLQIGAMPDRLLSLASDEARKNYIVELDRGQMDVDAVDLTIKRPSIRRKHLACWNAWRQNLHNTQWGF